MVASSGEVDKAAILLGVLATSVLVATGAPADDRLQSYRFIPRRNAFHLKPIPIRPDKITRAPTPLKVIFTGISDFAGRKAAYFEIHDPNKPTDPSALLFPCLSEGERSGGLKVLGINESAGSVRISNSGVEMTLTFEKNGNEPQAPIAQSWASRTPPVPWGANFSLQNPKAAFRNFPKFRY